jgi:hypothetical protein
MLKSNKDQIERIQDEYSAFNRALKETEHALNAINAVLNLFNKSQ